MELKYYMINRCANPNADSFNRTFMELKLSFQVWCRRPPKFQSYLYGIEIRDLITNKKVFNSFNRTFMELKYYMINRCANPNADSFNRTFMELKLSFQVWCRRPPKFQSYLYGIEIRDLITNKKVFNSFNRTFMELKYPCFL